MELDLYRGETLGDGTPGELHCNGELIYYTMEDLPHEDKIPGKTRIPAGRYPVKFREVLSAKTTHYRSKFPWFTWHLELQDVPCFKYVYIHIGNTPKDTDGCILVGCGKLDNKPFITRSTDAFTELYNVVSTALKEGEEVWINIYNVEGE